MRGLDVNPSKGRHLSRVAINCPSQDLKLNNVKEGNLSFGALQSSNIEEYLTHSTQDSHLVRTPRTIRCISS